jgi:REP element-mobilizing transposase RayT
MARPLRIQMAGGRYHLTARGNERKLTFKDDQNRAHFLDFVAELPERYGARIHAYVVMPNHFHAIMQKLMDQLSSVDSAEKHPILVERIFLYRPEHAGNSNSQVALTTRMRRLSFGLTHWSLSGHLRQ